MARQAGKKHAANGAIVITAKADPDVSGSRANHVRFASPLYPEAVAQWQGVIALGGDRRLPLEKSIETPASRPPWRNLLDQLPKDPPAGEQPYRMRSC